MFDILNRRSFLKRTAGLSAISMAPTTILPLQHDPVFGRDRYLLIDDRIIERVENASLQPGKVKKHPANPLFSEDKPWEVRIDNVYANVIFDQEEQLYKCWYSPFIVDLSAKGMTDAQRSTAYDPPSNREMGICYATSKDGLSWEKPELGLVEFDGSKANNIVWRGSQPTGQNWYDPHGTGIFKDLADPDPKRRYKAFLKGDILSVSFSADGIHWSPALPCPEADVPGDTHNNAFWAPTLGHYVGITRRWGDTYGRQVARTTSHDFVTWSKSEVVLEGLSKAHQTYAMPVFFYAGVYLGLLALYDSVNDRTWTEITWSADTIHWHRVAPGTPLIANAPNDRDYDFGCVYAAATPVFLNNEIRLYYGASDGYHFGWRNGFICLATLRPDGFAGYASASNKTASLTTHQISVRAGTLYLNADVSEGGSVNITVIDEKGDVLAMSETVKESAVQQMIRWKQGAMLNEGQVVQLKLEWQNAKVYSFGFA
ncbi:MAG: hypothetical protein AAF412_12940 [Pseudomonadota bacterium]